MDAVTSRSEDDEVIRECITYDICYISHFARGELVDDAVGTSNVKDHP